jgi:hypothetical protein
LKRDAGSESEAKPEAEAVERGVKYLARLWRKRWENLLEMSEKHGERKEYEKALECRIQAKCFIDALRELKDTTGI